MIVILASKPDVKCVTEFCKIIPGFMRYSEVLYIPISQNLLLPSFFLIYLMKIDWKISDFSLHPSAVCTWQYPSHRECHWRKCLQDLSGPFSWWINWQSWTESWNIDYHTKSVKSGPVKDWNNSEILQLILPGRKDSLIFSCLLYTQDKNVETWSLRALCSAH